MIERKKRKNITDQADRIIGGDLKMAYKITEACISCGACAETCPCSCISQGEERYEIDPEACINCGTCASVCPVDAPVSED